jgi:hypothetical protein
MLRDIGKLQDLEMVSPDDDRPLMADLPLFSICSYELVLPTTIAVFLLVFSFWIPQPFTHITLPQNSTFWNLTIVAELENLSLESPLVGLSLALENPSVVPFDSALTLALFPPGGDRPFRRLASHGSVRCRRSCLFKGSFMNSTKIQANVSLPVFPAMIPFDLVWTVTNGVSFNFLKAVKLISLTLTVPNIVAICQQLLEKEFPSTHQLLTFVLVIVSVAYYVPMNGVLPMGLWHIGGVGQAILEDLVLAFVSAHSVLIFVPYFAAELSQSFLGPPFCFILGLIGLSLFERLQDPGLTFFPESLLATRMSLKIIVGTVGHAVMYVIYALAAAIRIPQSKRNRFRFGLIVGTAVFGLAVIYVGIGLLDLPLVNSTFYIIAPVIGCLLYTTFLFYGFQETKADSVFSRVKIPDEGELGGDNSMGIELNDPTPLNQIPMGSR